MKKIAIIGSGFFGLSLAIKLSKKFKVDVYEKKRSLLQGASRANQLRYHLGYHYPRSQKTLKEVQKMKKDFEDFYGQDVFGVTDNFYGVARKNSKTSYKKYILFLRKNNLYFNEINTHDYSKEKVEGVIISNEKNLNYFIAKKKLSKLVKKQKINLFLKRQFKNSQINEYHKIIIACYDQNNLILKKLNIKPVKKYKYELVEKIIIKLPPQYKNKSYMVIDGQFVSLDPYLGTDKHLFSDVKFSKLEIKKGYYPNFNDYRVKFLNSGIIRNIKHSNFKKFVINSSLYLPFLKLAKYKGSFFVTRAIELDKENTDERLNSVNYFGKKIITIFSGKWNTSIGLANYISSKIK